MSKTKIKVNQKNLERLVKEKAITALEGKIFNIECPHCKTIVQVPSGKSICPHCHKEINLELNIKF